MSESERQTRRRAASENGPGAGLSSGDARAEFGERLAAERNSAPGRTQTEIAPALGLTSKAHVSAIERGASSIPWKAVVRFAELTGASPGGALILRALDQVLDQLPEKERALLLGDLAELLQLTTGTLAHDVLEPRTPDAAEVYRENTLRRAFGFWRNLTQEWHDVLLEYRRQREEPATTPVVHSLVPNVVALNGAYRELPHPTRRSGYGYRYVIRSKASAGAQLLLLDYLDTSPLALPVVASGVEIADGPAPLSEFVDHALNEVAGKSLSIDDPAVERSSFIVLRDLPHGQRRLDAVSRKVSTFLGEHRRASVAVLADANQSLADLRSRFGELAPYGTALLGEAVAIDTAHRFAEVFASKTRVDLEDWFHVALRHPIWLNAFGVFISSNGKIPTRCELTSHLGDSLLANLSEESSKILLAGCAAGLAAGTASALASGPSDQAREWSSWQPLCERTADERLSVAVPWLCGYLAALGDLQRALDEPEHVANSVRRAVASLSQNPDDPGAEHQFYWCVSLAWLARNRFPRLVSEVSEALLQETERSGSRAIRRLREVLASNGFQGFSMPPSVAHPPPAQGGGWQERNATPASDDSPVRILVEDEAPLRALVRLTTLEDAGAGRDLAVETLGAQPPGLIRKMLSEDRSRQEPTIDAVVCPDLSLATDLATTSRVAPLSHDDRVIDKLRSSLLAKATCYRDQVWIGVPFQFPTKYLCYRPEQLGMSGEEDVPATWHEFEEFLQRSDVVRRGQSTLTLQASPEHPALYYEWLAFALALGGADVLWSPSLQVPQVVLDSEQTVDATHRFFSLLEGTSPAAKAIDPRSTRTDWANIKEIIGRGETAMCVLFSDAVSELGKDWRCAPLRFLDRAQSPFAELPYGHPESPLHVSTQHVIVALKPERFDATRHFMTWYLQPTTQRRLVEVTYQPVLPESPMGKVAAPAAAPADADEREGLRHSAIAAFTVAAGYPNLPLRGDWGEDPSKPLPPPQQRVLGALSSLVAKLSREGETLDRKDIQREFQQCGDSLRQTFDASRSPAPASSAT